MLRLLVKPTIACSQLNHNFDGETSVECQVTSLPEASIIPIFASSNITSYDLLVDQVNGTKTLSNTNHTYIIKFSPNLSIVNTKMIITAVLDNHYTSDGSGKSVYVFEKPLSTFTEIRLKYNGNFFCDGLPVERLLNIDLLQMECTKMFVIENDFGFKCSAINMNNVDFEVEKLVAKTQPKIEIIKVGPWETEFHYRIRSDIDIVNKTVVVTVKPSEGGNPIKSIINLELPVNSNLEQR